MTCKYFRGFTIIIVCLLISSFDFSELEYKLKGKVYFKNRLIKNDNILLVTIGPNDSEDTIKKIEVNAFGEYITSVSWTEYCIRNCNGMNELECELYWNKRVNSDSLYFSYKNYRTAILNLYSEDVRARLNILGKKNEIISIFNKDIEFK